MGESEVFSAHASDSFARKHSRYILTLTVFRFVYNFFVLAFRSIRGAIVLLNTKLVWILVSSAFPIQSLSRCMVAVGPTSRLSQSCFRPLCPQPHVFGSCDWPLQWRFWSFPLCYQRHRCSRQFLGVSFGILSFTNSTCCRWTLSLWGFATTPRLSSRGYLSTCILTQLACKESSVTLLRSLQYGSKFDLRPLFAYQDQSRGRVLVQLYSGNVVSLGPPSLEEYQMHRVQHFNIQGGINTYVNYTLQFSSEPMRPLSMSLPMTNVSPHCFDYVASTALYSEASSQRRSYFSVLEHVAQASRLQQQLRLFLQDEDNPSLNNSLK